MIRPIHMNKWAFWYYACVFILLIKQWINILALHQFEQAQLIFPSIDNTYWLMHLIQIPDVIMNSVFLAYLLDISLLVFSFLLILFYRNVWLARLFALLFCIYFITVNTFSGHHSHMLCGILFCNFIFCFKSETDQVRLITLLRYYLLFAMCSAALWKIFRGSIFEQQHLSNIIYNQNAYSFLTNTTIGLNKLNYYLAQHTQISHVLYILATLIELSFIIGFFTRRYDKIIAFLFVLFFIFDKLLLGIDFSEFGILLLTLWPLRKSAFIM